MPKDINVRFKSHHYVVIFTEHARTQMNLRQITESDVMRVIENGEIKPKNLKNRYWVYMKFPKRNDNFISVSISIESTNLIVITALINWSPL